MLFDKIVNYAFKLITNVLYLLSVRNIILISWINKKKMKSKSN